MENTKISDVMSTKLVVCQSDDNLNTICRIMTENKTSCVFVAESNEISGIITERDITRHCAQEKIGLNLKASEIMTTEMKFLPQEANLTEAIEKVREYGVRRLPVKDINGKIVGIITQTDLLKASLDILNAYTDSLEKEVLKRTVELQMYSDEKDEFLGTAAHDLRNPLSVITAWTEMLSLSIEDQNNEDMVEGVQTIDKQARKMLTLINDLLDVNRIESSTVKMNMENIDLGILIESVFQKNLILARKKGISFEREIDEGLPEIFGDNERLCSVMENLISNAIKYSKSSDVVTIRAWGESKFVRVDVIDTGQGIADDKMEFLFKKFSKVGSKPTGGEQSTGLGLAIVKKTLLHHGGKIWAESEIGKGSTFSFDLPLAKV